VKTVIYRTVTVPARPTTPMPFLVPAQSASTVAAAPKPMPRVEEGSTVMASAEPSPAAEPAPSRAELVRIVPSTDAGAAGPVNTADARPLSGAPHAHSGWMIQIGAFDGEQEAQRHLDEAKHKLPALALADPFTETVQKGDTTLYRARFAGLDKETAEADCRKLRRSDVACVTLKN
jgi:D-alanyl-D-alanine carboxypeptidase